MNIFIFVSLFLFGWLIQNVVHELGHLIFAKVFCRYKAIDLIPWPHKYKNSFVFARCEYLPTYPRSEKECMIHVSPILVGIPLAILFLVLGILVSPYFFILFGYQLIDILFWVYGFIFGTDYADGKRFKNAVKFFEE